MSLSGLLGLRDSPRYPACQDSHPPNRFERSRAWSKSSQGSRSVCLGQRDRDGWQCLAGGFRWETDIQQRLVALVIHPTAVWQKDFANEVDPGRS